MDCIEYFNEGVHFEREHATEIVSFRLRSPNSVFPSVVAWLFGLAMYEVANAY